MPKADDREAELARLVRKVKANHPEASECDIRRMLEVAGA